MSLPVWLSVSIGVAVSAGLLWRGWRGKTLGDWAWAVIAAGLLLARVAEELLKK